MQGAVKSSAFSRLMMVELFSPSTLKTKQHVKQFVRSAI